MKHNGTVEERDHSACGVGLRVNLSKIPSHKHVLDALDDLKKMGYRAAENEVTGESDGVGIKCYGIPVGFFNKLITEGEFVTPNGHPLQHHLLTEKQFIIGQYFLPHNHTDQTSAKLIIEAAAKVHGLYVVGWRDLNTESAVDLSVLSESARLKKPSMWQAILERDSTRVQVPTFDLESAALCTTALINHEATEQQLQFNVISQSSEAIIYKGMLTAEQLDRFYKDLRRLEYKATAALVHSRFATNTDPQWANAQPCEHWAHNGELNSAPANAADMRSELDARQFEGTYPNPRLSDSAQMSADLANQMIMKNISLIEAFVRLLPPNASTDYSPEVNAMLRCFQMERKPYNGPAFGGAGAGGYYLIIIDKAGLRPSRWSVIEHANGQREFIAASDDFVENTDDVTVVEKGQLEGASMMVITPEGRILQTAEVLEQICQRYNAQVPQKNHFQTLLNNTLAKPLPTQPDPSPSSTTALHRKLYAAGWDHESAEIVHYMAIHGSEKVIAMGDDTNPLYTQGTPGHISYFFHQLFAQVSAPPQDSTHEPENFSLKTTLGPMLGEGPHHKIIPLESPVLAEGQILSLMSQQEVRVTVLDTHFDVSTISLQMAIEQLLQKVQKEAEHPGVIVLSDNDSQGSMIPDVIAIAAVRRHLERHNLSRRVSIVVDTHQVAGPHHVAVLLSLGAHAIYPRGAYAKIRSGHEGSSEKYCHALEKALLKTMGKMGIHDVNAYINGCFIGALGIDLTDDLTLAKIFPGMYSPLKGINLQHIHAGLALRHAQATHEEVDFTRLPHSGYFMPEKNGIKHGYGPNVVTAFTEWLKSEDLRMQLKRMHTILEKKGFNNYVEEPFTAETGFLDPSKKNRKGFYRPEDLESFKPSRAFENMIRAIDEDRKSNPTALHDYFDVVADPNQPQHPTASVQSQEDIRKRLFSGSMSQGALTVSDPNTPKQLGAHEALTRGMNAVGAQSAAGEGGEAPHDLLDPLKSTRSKQIASGRFGVSVMQIISAAESDGEIEIKMAQGGKPGEGGQLPGTKVSVRLASQRHVLPGTPCISPPPHHDIYSIEDLTQLIECIKAVKPTVKVTVKLVASPGIGTIAVGVAKAGADGINIGCKSGGTGAAGGSSIKHTGFPAELGLVEVDKALRKTGLRNLVQLRTSGGFKTPEDVIVAAILGADLFEFGTTAMLTLGCEMLRKCNESCQPGIATDGHLFKGDQINVERYFVNMAAAIQARLKALGVNSLEELKGRTDLLVLHNPAMATLYDFSVLKHDKFPEFVPPPGKLDEIRRARVQRLADPLEMAVIEKIRAFFEENPSGTFTSPIISLTTVNRSFGSRVAGEFAKHLIQHPTAKIILRTNGFAGQSMGFVLPQGMEMHHEGSVQDGVAKSMTGGEIIVKTPQYHPLYQADKNTVAGNAIAYGASGGKLFIEGRVGHRLGILCKGAEIVVEGAGNRPFGGMSDGTGMIIGPAGMGLCSSAVGGIVFAYDETGSLALSQSSRFASDEEAPAYVEAIRDMLREHHAKTGSKKAKALLADFNPAHFKVCIPKALDQIASIAQVIDVLKMYQMRQSPISRGMHVWLSKKIMDVYHANHKVLDGSVQELRDVLQLMPEFKTLAATLAAPQEKGSPQAHEATNSSSVTIAREGQVHIYPKTARPIEERLSDVNGILDEVLWDALENIQAYANTLSHDAQGCSGCAAQSCAGNEEVKTGCPSGKQINTINAILKKMGPVSKGQPLTLVQWELLREAFFVQTKESPFISYTGAACTAPCQDACTETIPNAGDPNPKRDHKPVGEYVHIKDIEFCLYQVGRALGWFAGKKQFSPAEVTQLFGNPEGFKAYDQALSRFAPLFILAKRFVPGKKLIIVGSGPAAMQLAYQALKDGIPVSMYEKSDRPGGLLVDGIPAHKFDKSYIAEDFAYLKAMGLDLQLNSEVYYLDNHYYVMGKESPIAQGNHPDQHVAICVGAGKARDFPSKVTETLSKENKVKIIQAIDFLKAANDVADFLKRNPDLSEADKEKAVNDRFKHMNPKGKKIVVVGGGDTAQDVIRWIARYFNQDRTNAELNVLVRGPQINQRGIADSYPAQSLAPTKENKLQAQEIQYVNGNRFFQVEPHAIAADAQGKLAVQLLKTKYKAAEIIESDPELQEISEKLPRAMKPMEAKKDLETLESVDMVICALGFEGGESSPLVKAVKSAQLQNVSFAGDASGIESQIIVGAQASASKTYAGRIAPALGVAEKPKPGLIRFSLGAPLDKHKASSHLPSSSAPVRKEVLNW